MSELHPDEDEIFEKASQLSGEERVAYLESAVRGDHKLRQHIENLLDAHENAGSFLQNPPVAVSRETLLIATSKLAGAEKPSDKIGRYKLLQLIGKGGFGDVWMAEQEEPVRRRVALKIIKLGMNSAEVVARFEAERQALAWMDHPSVAKIFDAGATEQGRPYFVMELVSAKPITDFCDENRLSTPDRLALFHEVCLAMQHAHQKGIIHRDIKPSNVLVAEVDGRALPKIIDFGVAKAIDARLTQKTLFTRFGQVVGTPPYMSPEQTRQGGLDVDTRTDVYSLGVLLYELLTGRTPLDAKKLREAGYDEMLKTIREAETPRPSTRLSKLSFDELDTAARQRDVEPDKLGRLVRGELDWIVMKALEKDRARRYETVGAFAKDIQNHLRHEPVTAAEPSAFYKFQKFARRHFLGLGIGAGFLVLLIMAAIVVTWMLHKSTLAEIAQRRAQEEAVMQRAVAEGHLYDALTREAAAIRMTRRFGYREEVFRLLQRANSLKVPERNIRALRQEAVACLGDSLGLRAVEFTKFPLGLSIRSASVASDGGMVAFLLSDGTISVFDVPSSEPIATVAEEQPAESLCFSGDRSLVSIHRPELGNSRERSEATTVRTWLRDESHLWQKRSTVSAPGAFACVASYGEPVILAHNEKSNSLDLMNSKLRSILSIPNRGNGELSSWSMNPDSHLLALLWKSQTTKMELWDTQAHTMLRDLPGLYQGTAVELSSDGTYLSCLCPGRRTIDIYSTDHLMHIVTLKDFFWDNSQAVFTGHGAILAIPRVFQNRLRLWDVAKTEDIGFLEAPEIKGISSPPGGRFLLAYGHRSARLFQMDSGPEETRFLSHPDTVRGISFSPEGTRLASACEDHRIRIWDVATQRKIWESPQQSGPVQSLAYSQDGRWIVSTTRSGGSICLWNAATGEPMNELGFGPLNRKIIWSAQFSQDSHYLAAAMSLDGLALWALPAVVWSDSATRVIPRIRSLKGDFWSFHFTPDGRQMLFLKIEVCPSGRGAGNLFLWDFAGSGSVRLLSSGISYGGQSYCICPDGRSVFALDQHESVLKISLAKGGATSKFAAAADRGSQKLDFSERTMLLSPDGTMLALSSSSRTRVDVWEANSGRLLYALPAANGTVEWLAWSSDSSRLAIARFDGAVSLWNMSQIENTLRNLGLTMSNGGNDHIHQLPPNTVELDGDQHDPASKESNADPSENAEFAYFKALGLFDEGNTAEAKEAFRRFLTVAPKKWLNDSPQWKYIFGRTLEAGEHARMEELFGELPAAAKK